MCKLSNLPFYHASTPPKKDSKFHEAFFRSHFHLASLDEAINLDKPIQQVRIIFYYLMFIYIALCFILIKCVKVYICLHLYSTFIYMLFVL